MLLEFSDHMRTGISKLISRCALLLKYIVALLVFHRSFFPLLDAVFGEQESRTDEDKMERKKTALSNFQTFLRPLLQPCLDKKSFEEGTELVFKSIQDPVINKQVISNLIASRTFLVR